MYKNSIFVSSVTYLAIYVLGFSSTRSPALTAASLCSFVTFSSLVPESVKMVTSPGGGVGSGVVWVVLGDE